MNFGFRLLVFQTGDLIPEELILLDQSCTPGMGASLWGESPLYENLKVFITMDTTKSISRRQGRKGDRPSEGSQSANVRNPSSPPLSVRGGRVGLLHIRLSPWASWPHTTRPVGSKGRVNAAVVHGKLTFLSGEICLPCGKTVMSKIRRGFTRLTKNPAYLAAVTGYEPKRETQNRQHLMMSHEAPCMAICRESKQKSAEGILGHVTEGPNAEMSGGHQ